MHVRDYLLADDCAITHESRWLDLASVAIPSGELVVADPTLYPDGLVIRVRPGLYHVQVVIRSESGFQTVSRLRACSCEPDTISGSVGAVSVDFARLGVGDNTQIAGIASAITPELAKPIWETLETVDIFGIVNWSVGTGTAMPFVTPGDGDGRYDVRELLCRGERIGVQVEFLPEQS